MENISPQAHHNLKKDRTKRALLTVIVLLLLAGGNYYYHVRYKRKPAAKNGVSSTQQRKFDMSMLKKQTPAPLTNLQQQQLSQGTSTSTKEKRFFVMGENFFFTPNTITVNQGDNIAVIFNDIYGLHDFVIDALQVKTPVGRPGQFAVAKFTADKKGTYEFYSDVSTDRKQGMKGTFIIQ